MKVLHVVNAASTGGAQTLIENLARVQSDVESSVLVILGEDHLSERFGQVAEVTHLGVSTRSLRLDKIARSIASHIRKAQPDVLHSHLLQADLACLVANRRSQVAHVSTVHTTGMTAADPMKSRLIARAVGRGSRRFDAAVACTRTALRYMDDMGYASDGRRLIPNGVPVAPSISSDYRRGDGQQLVCLSRWHPMKDHANLFEAFARVRDEYPTVRLICAGTGMTESNEDLVALVRRWGLSGAVDLLGPTDQVAQLLRQSVASVISSSYGEALPMAGLESISLGVPLIGTSVGEVPDLVVDERLLVRPGDAAALAGAMATVFELNDSEHRTLASDSHARALRSYNVSDTASSYVELYEDVLR